MWRDLNIRPAMCTATEVQHHKSTPPTPPILDYPNPTAKCGWLIGRLSLRRGVWPHMHSSQPDWLQTLCLQKKTNPQTWFPKSLTFSAVHFQPHWFVPLYACSVHSWLMHTQARLFVYAKIFSNRAGEGYTASGKHWNLRRRVSVSLPLVYNISPPQGRRYLIIRLHLRVFSLITVRAWFLYYTWVQWLEATQLENVHHF